MFWSNLCLVRILKELVGIWKSDACGVLEYKYGKDKGLVVLRCLELLQLVFCSNVRWTLDKLIQVFRSPEGSILGLLKC